MKLYTHSLDFMKGCWTRLALHLARNGREGRQGKWDMLYMVEDPWHMASPAEQYRFEQTNRIIRENFGPVGSLLEIGCGEGHQSAYLERICSNLTGLDVSGKAVLRARKRCPQSRFLTGDIFSRELEELAPFDLVVACEVVHYIADVQSVLDRLGNLSANRLVTCYAGAIARLDPFFARLPGAVTEILKYGGSQWRATWWRQSGHVMRKPSGINSPAGLTFPGSAC